MMSDNGIDIKAELPVGVEGLEPFSRQQFQMLSEADSAETAFQLEISPESSYAASIAFCDEQNQPREFAEFQLEVEKILTEISEVDAAAAYQIILTKNNREIDEPELAAVAMQRKLITGMSPNLVRVGESLTEGFAREAFDVEYVQYLRKENVKTFENMIESWQQTDTVNENIKALYQKDIAETIIAGDIITQNTDSE